MLFSWSISVLLIAVVISSINCQTNSNKQSTNSSVPNESNSNAAKVPSSANENTGVVYSDSGIIKPVIEKPLDEAEEKSSIEKVHTRKVTNTSVETIIPDLNQSEQKIATESKSTNISNGHVNENSDDKSNSSNKPQSNQSKSGTSNNNSTLSTKSTPKPITKTTTTTKIVPLPSVEPKKPTITYSVEDVPGLLSKVIEQQKLNAPELPIAETIRENEYNDEKSSHMFMVPIIGIIVILPFLVIFTNCAVRRIRDYLSKRRYRRMDYLIEDMYN